MMSKSTTSISSRPALIALSLLISSTLAACGSSDSPSDETSNTPPETSNPPVENPLTEETPPSEETTSSFWLEGPDPSERQAVDHSYTFNGVVFYNAPVAGAEVCIDTARDFTCDEQSSTAITNEDGTFSLSVDVPYATPEFFILAKVPSAELNAEDPYHVFASTDNTTTLAARAYYRGVINPASTLEALQYDADLSYLQQLERYSISRTLIGNIYGLSGRQNLAKTYQDEAADMETSEITAYNNELLKLYGAALQYVEQPYQGLHLLAEGIELAQLEAGAEYFGYKPQGDTFAALTQAQRALVQEAVLTPNAQSILSLYPNVAEVRNENNGERVLLEVLGNSTFLQGGNASDYQMADDQVCWNEGAQRWVSSPGDLASFTIEESSGSNQYQLTNRESGQIIKLHMTPVELQSELATTATSGWNEQLDLSVATVDSALVRGRFEYEDALCVFDGWSSSEEVKRFSQMSADEIVEFVSPMLYEQQAYDTDEQNQFIRQHATGDTVHYRVVERGGEELLFLVSVDGSPNVGYWNTWGWENGEARRVDFLSAERSNTIAAGVSQFAVSDAAAVNLADQLRALGSAN